MNSEPSFEWEEREDSVPVRVHFLAGSLAGLTEHLIILPFDNIKTRLQSGQNSITEAFRSVYQRGVGTFFRGSSVVTISCVPSHALFFANYEIGKRYFDSHNRFDLLGNMALGASSTIFHDLIMTPAEMVKQRNQLLPDLKASFIIKEVYRQEGIQAFWRSLPVNLCSNIPQHMAIVTANENLKILAKKFKEKLSIFDYFLCSFLSGAIASTLTTPLDNIKT